MAGPDDNPLYVAMIDDIRSSRELDVADSAGDGARFEIIGVEPRERAPRRPRLSMPVSGVLGSASFEGAVQASHTVVTEVEPATG